VNNVGYFSITVTISMTNLYYLKRDLLLKNSFDRKALDFIDAKLPPLVVKTSLKRGLVNKESLVGGAFYLEMITGQKAIGSRAKKSNALFKIRQGDIIGWQVTLRNQKLDHFLTKWTKAILPLEQNLYQISNLSLFLELNEQVLPDNVTIHLQFSFSSIQSIHVQALLLSGYNFPVKWLSM